jgi:hypothetical protein
MTSVACNSNEGSTTGQEEKVENPLETKIIGQWKYYKELEGLTDEMDYIIHFKDDGTYTSTGNEKVKGTYDLGKWSIVENILYLKTIENSNQIKVIIEIKNNQLFIKNADGNDKGKIRNIFYAEREFHQEIYDKIE